MKLKIEKNQNVLILYTIFEVYYFIDLEFFFFCVLAVINFLNNFSSIHYNVKYN